MIAVNSDIQIAPQKTVGQNAQTACNCVCPCCKQRRCTAPAGHRSLPASDKQHWHRCDCGVCPVW